MRGLRLQCKIAKTHKGREENTKNKLLAGEGVCGEEAGDGGEQGDGHGEQADFEEAPGADVLVFPSHGEEPEDGGE